MFGRTKVFGGMFILRRITASHMPAHSAQTEMNPSVSHLKALLASMRIGLHMLDLINVRTLFHSRISLSISTCDLTAISATTGLD
jgi:hypothetical protein